MVCFLNSNLHYFYYKCKVTKKQNIKEHLLLLSCVLLSCVLLSCVFFVFSQGCLSVTRNQDIARKQDKYKADVFQVSHLTYLSVCHKKVVSDLIKLSRQTSGQEKCTSLEQQEFLKKILIRTANELVQLSWNKYVGKSLKIAYEARYRPQLPD